MINYPFTFAYCTHINIKYRIHSLPEVASYIYIYDLTPNLRARIQCM